MQLVNFDHGNMAKVDYSHGIDSFTMTIYTTAHFHNTKLMTFETRREKFIGLQFVKFIAEALLITGVYPDNIYKFFGHGWEKP